MSVSSPWRALAGIVLIWTVMTGANAYEIKAPGGGDVHALVVGINGYPNMTGHDLKGAVADAKNLAAALANGGVTDLQLLLDADATRASFVAAMDRLVAIAKPGDFVFVSYAGHGLQVKEYDVWRGIDPGGFNDEIALSGYSPKSPQSGDVVINIEVRAWLSRLNAKGVDVLVVWDSCFGGGMRAVAPGGATLLVRRLHETPQDDIRQTFRGIPMTSLEARANANTMEHVTFLAGADAFSSVPELTGMDRDDPGQVHGALSFVMGRALRGALAVGAVTRLALFDGVRQGVREASRDQAMDLAPRSEDPAVSGRVVFVVENPTLATSREEAPVRLGIVDGSPDAFKTIVPGRTPLTFAKEADTAELVWNPSKRQALTHGDVLMENIDASIMGAIADRVRALARLRALSEGRRLQVKVGRDGEAFVPPALAHATVSGLDGSALTVFNIAADATVQMLMPPPPPASKDGCPPPEVNLWVCDLKVSTPYGVDTVVAVATKTAPKEFQNWLKEHHGQRDAANLTQLLGAMAGKDDSLRVGYAEIVTAPAK